MARYNVSLPEYVVETADRKANELGISRSAFIQSAILFKVQYDEIMARVPFMLDTLKARTSPDQMRELFGSSAANAAQPGAEDEA